MSIQLRTFAHVVKVQEARKLHDGHEAIRVVGFAGEIGTTIAKLHHSMTECKTRQMECLINLRKVEDI